VWPGEHEAIGSGTPYDQVADGSALVLVTMFKMYQQDMASR
jgi:hypothetical protein